LKANNESLLTIHYEKSIYPRLSFLGIIASGQVAINSGGSTPVIQQCWILNPKQNGAGESQSFLNSWFRSKFNAEYVVIGNVLFFSFPFRPAHLLPVIRFLVF
jgi:hypothetical protein